MVLIVATAVGLVLSASTHAAFSTGPGGVGYIDDFSETQTDTATWATFGNAVATHEDGKLKFSATVGFNQAYTTVKKIGSILEDNGHQLPTAPEAARGPSGQNGPVGPFYLITAEIARIDTNTLAGDRVVTNLSLCERNNFRCFGEGLDQVSYAWSQNDGFPMPHSQEMINLEIRSAENNSIAGAVAPLDPPIIGPDRLDPDAFTPRVLPRDITGGEFEPGLFEPMEIGEPAHFYRLEIWRDHRDALTVKSYDPTPIVDKEHPFNTDPITIIHEASVDWSESFPGDLDDDHHIQIYLHHGIFRVDHVRILQNPKGMHAEIVAQAAASPEQNAGTGPVANSFHDIDQDGDVDGDDVDAWMTHYGLFDDQTIPTVRGDLNLDFKVDIIDFGVFAGNFGQKAGLFEGDLALGTDSDLVADGVADIVDFGIFAGNFGFDGFSTTPPTSTGASVVPEPAAMALLTLGGLVILRHRREKSPPSETANSV